MPPRRSSLPWQRYKAIKPETFYFKQERRSLCCAAPVVYQNTPLRKMVLHKGAFCVIIRLSRFRSKNEGFYRSQLPTVLGKGMASRMLPMPVRYMTQRSKPRPKPAWRAEPYLRRSM